MAVGAQPGVDGADAGAVPDLVARDFTAERPGEKLVGDVTYKNQIWAVPQFYQSPAIVLNTTVMDAAGVKADEIDTSKPDVLLAAIASLVTRWVVIPVRRAARGAQRLSTGNLDERMPVRGVD